MKEYCKTLICSVFICITYTILVGCSRNQQNSLDKQDNDCANGKKYALNQISRGNFQVPGKGPYFDQLYQYHLRKKYGITFSLDNPHIHPFWSCFNKIMLDTIFAKYGDSVLIIAEQEAKLLYANIPDSLTPYNTINIRKYHVKPSKRLFTREYFKEINSVCNDELYMPQIRKSKIHESHWSGTTTVGFTVNVEGFPEDFEIIEKCNPIADSISMKCIQKELRWMPASLNDKPVPIRETITFFWWKR
jgi:hypothetical protein